MKRQTRMVTIADALFTLFCLITVICWYLKVPYRVEVTCVLAFLALGTLIFFKKGLESESEFIDSYTKLLENEDHFRSAFDFAGSGMALLSRHGHCLRVNHSLCQMLGYNENELLTISLRKIIHPDDFRRSLQKIRAMLNGEIKAYQSILRFVDKHQETRWIVSTFSFVCDKNNNPLYFVAQFQNINEPNNAKGLNAYHDSLTGLPNRSLLDQHVNSLIETAKENTKYCFAIFIVDLDSLKTINDSSGHEMGDATIKIVADRIKHVIRNEDVMARIGGDEFAIVINKVNQVEVIAQIAQKILSVLLKSITLSGRELYITASIGIAMYPHDGEDIKALLTSADLALFRAKKNGGNSYEFCTQDMTKKAQEKTRQQAALNQAMAKNELQLFYQPCVNAATQEITCIEALIRWQSSEYGLVMPDTIIPLAEESGLIVPISEWVLRTACKQVKVWQKAGYTSLKLAINLSAYQFKNSNFMKNIIRALKECEFSPQDLILEITEGLIMHDHINTISILTQLKKEGVSIVVDDFGTGFSSFTYLTNYAVDKIKIDRTFIQQMAKGKAEIAIVSAMISMANKLGIKAVAEGVETKQEYDVLLQEGCNEIQGYYIAKPLPIELMESFLATRIPKTHPL